MLFFQSRVRRRAGFLAFPERGAGANPLLWLAVLFAIGVAMPFVPVPNHAAALLGAVIVTVVYVVAVMGLIVGFTRLQLPPAKVAALFFGCLLLWAILGFVIQPQLGAPDAIFLRVIAATLRNLSLLGAASLLGVLVSKLITDANMMAPICALIALIDIWGVLFGGIVAQMLEKAPEVSRHAMTTLPTVGAATGAPPELQIPLPEVGAGDYLFLGLLFAALHAHKMNWRGAANWVTPLITLALLSIPLSLLIFDRDIMLPGLVFIGLGVALPNLKFFNFTRDEKFALVWAGVFVGILTIGLYFAAPTIVGAAQNLESTNRAAK